jgi:archaellum component FlaC
LLNKLQQLRNDMGVWENNIGFFKQSDSSEDTIQGYQEKIEEAPNRIEILEKKIRILDDMENEN